MLQCPMLGETVTTGYYEGELNENLKYLYIIVIELLRFSFDCPS